MDSAMAPPEMAQQPLAEEAPKKSARELPSLGQEGPDHGDRHDPDYVRLHLSQAIEFNEVVSRSFISHGSDRDRRCNSNIRALALSAFLFGLITVVQVFAAKIAHSQALLMDCISMGVDAFTYLGNIVVECRKRDGGSHARSQLVVVALSLGCLTYFTIDASRESWETLMVCWGKAKAGEEEEDVNGWITFGFGVGGLAFDLACVWAFHRSHREVGGRRQVNMFSALLHVGADLLRSTSTVVMSLLILCAGVDSACIDAHTSILIGATIIFGALTGFYSWVKLLVSYCRGRA